MNSPDHPSSINPYQPPADLDPRLEFERALVEQSSIAFSGSAVNRDLHEFVASYDSGSWPTIAAGLILLSLLQLWSFMVGIFFALIVASGLLIAVSMAIVSSRAYRAVVFRSANPNWCEPVSGELVADGLRIDRRSESCFYRWNWFSGVVVADHMVGFLPMLESEAPILIGETMLPGSISLEQLKRFAISAKVVCERGSDVASSTWAIQQVMKSPDRERQAEVPAGAIPFEGSITGADIKTLPPAIRRPSRPLRAHVIRAVIMAALGCFLLGGLMMLGEAGLGLAGLAFLILGGSVFLVILRYGDQRRRFLRDDDMMYYLIAYADDEGVATDYSVAVTKLAWNDITICDQSPNRIALGQRMSRRILIARRDMFASSDDWQRFVSRVRTKKAMPAQSQSEAGEIH